MGDRQYPQRSHYLTNIIATNHEASMESPLSQREPQVLDKKVISGVSKTEQQIRTREYTGAKTGSTSQPLAVPSIADSQSSLNMKGTPGRRAIELMSTEHRGQESRNARKERKRKPTWETSETGAKCSPSKSDAKATLPQQRKAACRREHAMSLAVPPDLARTEQQLLSSKSNYEILRSGNQSLANTAFPASLQASIKDRRAQHQREEKVRRDRMKRALEALADVLPHKPGSQAAVGRDGSTNTNRAETVENAVEYIRELHKKSDVQINTKKEAVSLNNKKD